GEGRIGVATSTLTRRPIRCTHGAPASRRGRGIFLLLLLMSMASCSVGPRYKTPTAPIPPAFKETAGWKQAQPQDDVLREKWWELFSDPQLNTVEEQVNVSNQTIAVAEAEFRAARAAIGVARSGLFPALNVGASAVTS